MKKPWRIIKFGGGCMANNEEIVAVVKRIIEEIKQDIEHSFVFVFSAMGKMTNSLENLAFLNGGDESELLKLKDSIVAEGELYSTTLIGTLLETQSVPFVCIDAMEIIKTDANFGEANVDLEKTRQKINDVFNQRFGDQRIFITQGFIGSTASGETTTLGREGSDYTAALLGLCLGAESVELAKKEGGIFEHHPDEVSIGENNKLIKKMTFVDLEKKINDDPSFKAVHKKVVQSLSGSGISLIISHPYTGEVGTIIKD